METNKMQGTEHQARAKAMNIAVSTKHSIVISNFLRYKNTAFAKSFLEDVIKKRKAVPFTRFNRDTGHKRGMAAGRYPVKAAAEFLRLIKSVEANAQGKGLNTSSLKIVKILANKAAIPVTGGRQRSATKRSHIEVVVAEGKVTKRNDKKDSSAKGSSKDSSKESVKNKEANKEVSKNENNEEVMKKPTNEKPEENSQKSAVQEGKAND